MSRTGAALVIRTVTGRLLGVDVGTGLVTWERWESPLLAAVVSPRPLTKASALGEVGEGFLIQDGAALRGVSSRSGHEIWRLGLGDGETVVQALSDWNRLYLVVRLRSGAAEVRAYAMPAALTADARGEFRAPNSQ